MQVSAHLSPENEPREVQGLLEALDYYKLSEGIILTDHQEELRTVHGKKIRIVPVWKWILKPDFKPGLGALLP
jgi:hypothetical protein